MLNEHISATVSLFLPLYNELFNKFDNGFIPDERLVCIVKPIYKTGDPAQPENHRPLSLLSCLGKLLT